MTAPNPVMPSQTQLSDSDVLMLRARDVKGYLADREMELIEIARAAYAAHETGAGVSPQSVFLRFPDAPRNRIIAKPSYLGGERRVAGLKWVSSFPGNVARGMERSSAVVMLNSADTGRVISIVEGSIINFKRTAASAALAALLLCAPRDGRSTGIIGCGPINFEVVRFLLASFPEARDFHLYDLDRDRAKGFALKCRDGRLDASIRIANDVEEVLRDNSLISIATTAMEPHISSLGECLPGTLILHISLRDIFAEAILNCDNVVDDADHVCSAQTSIHLAEQKVCNRDFIRCSLGEVLLGKARPRQDPDGVTVFSPFGLAVLDLAVAKFVYDLALLDGRGTVIDSFQ